MLQYKFVDLFVLQGKNSLVKFTELFKSWVYRHLHNRVLENLQNFSG